MSVEKEWLKIKEGALAGIAQWNGCRLRTKGLPFRFLIREHAWVAGQVPSSGACERQPHIDVSLPLFPPFLSF